MSKKGAIVFLVFCLIVGNVACICAYFVGKSEGKRDAETKTIRYEVVNDTETPTYVNFAHSEWTHPKTADDAELLSRIHI